MHSAAAVVAALLLLVLLAVHLVGLCCCYRPAASFLLVFFVLPHSSANYNGGCSLRFFLLLCAYACVCTIWYCLCVCFTQCCILIFTLIVEFGVSLELSCRLTVGVEVARQHTARYTKHKQIC